MLERKLFYASYDMDATTYKYGRLWGPHPGDGAAKTAGSSTTITASVLGRGTFAPLTQGSLITFRTGSETYARRKVVTPGADTIVVDTAIDLGTVGVPWSYYRFDIGATAADGWHYVQAWEPPITFIFEPTTIAAAGGVDIQIEGLPEQSPSTPVILVPTANYAASAAPTVRTISDKMLKLRVGVKGNGGFAGTDDFSVSMEGNFRR